MADTHVRIEVADVDPLRAERLTRALRQDLGTVDTLLVAYADRDTTVPSGTKGGVPLEVLELTATVAWPLAAPLLAEKIKSWLRREEPATVRITVGFDHVEITGSPTPTQERLLLALLDRQGEE